MSTWKCFTCDIATPCGLSDPSTTDAPQVCPFRCGTPVWVRVDGTPFTVVGYSSTTDGPFSEYVLADSAEEARQKLNMFYDRVVMVVFEGHHKPA